MNNLNHYYDSEEIRRVVSVVVLNEDSVLSRISGLFSARGYNIHSLTVAPIAENKKYSRITIVTKGDKRISDQITKQLNKLIPVLRVNEHVNFIEKDTVLIKIPIEQSLSDLYVVAKTFNGIVQTITETSIVLSATDDPVRIQNFIKAIQRFKPIEVVRSGSIAIER